MDGGLLLELYSRDGVGCMISTDFYEGIRRASGTVSARWEVVVGSKAAWRWLALQDPHRRLGGHPPRVRHS